MKKIIFMLLLMFLSAPASYAGTTYASVPTAVVIVEPPLEDVYMIAKNYKTGAEQEITFKCQKDAFVDVRLNLDNDTVNINY